MTLEEIAKEIGVSKSTVSRALSGKGRIGEKTRNRILEVAKRGEEREEMARTRTVTHNIGVVLLQTFIMEAVFISRTVCSASANRHRCSGTMC